MEKIRGPRGESWANPELGSRKHKEEKAASDSRELAILLETLNTCLLMKDRRVTHDKKTTTSQFGLCTPSVLEAVRKGQVSVMSWSCCTRLPGKGGKQPGEGGSGDSGDCSMLGEPFSPQVCTEKCGRSG